MGVRRVRRLMRAAQIVARGRRRACRTTVSDPAATAANLLGRRFQVARPNTVWAADITGLMTAEGWLYLAVLIDLASRKVVGWATRNTLEADVAVAALTRALETRDVAPGLLHHSDRGVQYTCDRYRGLLSRAGLTVSMSRVGNCWDNAVVESFFSSLKAELVPEPMWATRHDATAAIARYMRFYNERRLHSSLGYCSPQQHEAKLAAVV